MKGGNPGRKKLQLSRENQMEAWTTLMVSQKKCLGGGTESNVNQKSRLGKKVENSDGAS